MVGTGKRLLVETEGDLYAIRRLMGAHVAWGNHKTTWPVEIQATGGVDVLLDQRFLGATLKEQEVRTLGIVVDADERAASRWQSARDLCRHAFPDIPNDLPIGGLICDNAEGKRLGIWVMPDNASSGMLETFLGWLAPSSSELLWQYAQQAAGEAKQRGAPCKDCHRDKANIHTWLAWQDPPGRTLGVALLHKWLDPTADPAIPFVKWFRELYTL